MEMAIESVLNLWSIIVAAVVGMIIGAFWYSPIVFGNVGMTLVGLSKKDFEKAKERGMAKSYIITFISILIMSIILAIIINWNGTPGIRGGIRAAFLAWLGFIATTMLGTILWEGKPFKLYLINAGYYLVALLIMGAIIGIWR